MICCKCKQDKDLSEFRDYCIRNRDYICIPCYRIRAMTYYKSESCRNWRLKNEDKAIAISRKYRSLNRDKKIKANKAARVPEQHNARVMAQRALKIGTIKKEPCSVCGKERSEMHHPDYSKPLDIIWLCRSHHQYLHSHAAICKAMEGK